MAIVRTYSTLKDELDRIFDEMDRSFSSPWQSPARRRDSETNSLMSVWAPPVDIIEEETEVRIKASTPGCNPDDIDIEVGDNVVTLHGKSTKASEENKGAYHRREITMGEFYRQIPLPCEVDGDRANASFEHGILNVTIPKSAKTRRHRIKIGS